MSKTTKTPTFVCELPLKVNAQQEAVLLARLEAARQVYNACLGQALARREKMLHSRVYQQARAMHSGKARSQAFAEARAACGFGEYDLHSYAAQFGHSWLGDHLDSLVVQKLASRAFEAVEQYHFGKHGRPRFKSYGQLDSVEGKTNTSGLRWYEEGVKQGDTTISTGVKYVGWLGLRLEPILDSADKVVEHSLAAPVKYVRLVRRKLNGQPRFYVQLVCRGRPYRKEKHTLGTRIVGLDIGPSSIAILAPLKAILLLFCAQLARCQHALRRLQRQLDRQRRANNADHYNADGS